MRETEEKYFAPAIYAIQGALLLILLFLASEDKPPAFTASLGNSAAEWTQNFFYLLLVAGLLSISAAILRNSQRTVSGILGLQGILAGFWFGAIVFNSSFNSIFRHDADVWPTSVLALFFLPLFVTFPVAVKDLLVEENGAAI